MGIIQNLFDIVTRTSPSWRRFFMLALDLIPILPAYLLAHALIDPTQIPLIASKDFILIFLVAGISRRLSGLHALKLYGSNLFVLKHAAVTAIILSAFMFFTPFLWQAQHDIETITAFSIILSFGGTFLRIICASIMDVLQRKSLNLEPVVIFGVSRAGIQLIAALKMSRGMRVVALVDESPTVQGSVVAGFKVQNPDSLGALVKNRKIKKIIIGLDRLTRQSRQDYEEKLAHLNCEIQFIPSVSDLLREHNWSKNLSSRLLPRHQVDLQFDAFDKEFCGRAILVSGAGGSIGSEICLRLLQHQPSKIILFEQSEFALYQIGAEMRGQKSFENVEIIPILGSVCDSSAVEECIKLHHVEIIIHAAAYKHVPIIENSQIEGLSNNIFSTNVICALALKYQIARVVLVSTDKAVRPTNIMGATKRIAELILQVSQRRSQKTIFSSVRFGNVLESSGSVVPLFKKQIENGGPVTITHKEMTRYFMTVEEAAQLVLTAGAMAEGGEVFLLDMGKPIKIADIAKQLITLAGYHYSDKSSQDNVIQIKEIGLREGEKLYEELLIGDNCIETPHPKIMRAIEPSISEEELQVLMKELNQIVDHRDYNAISGFLTKWVDGYRKSLH